MNMQELINILVCPKCRGRLAETRHEDRSGFICEACGLVYPIMDDIPVMLIDQAIPLEKWSKTTDN